MREMSGEKCLSLVIFMLFTMLNVRASLLCRWQAEGNATDSVSRISGMIDEVRVYNRALSETEVMGLYSLGDK